MPLSGSAFCQRGNLVSASLPVVKRAPNAQKRYFLGFTTAIASCACLIAAHAQTNYQRILTFGPSALLGSAPRGQLIEASDGFLYGTTYQGGSNNLGTVFKVAKDGSGLVRLCNFTNAMFSTAGVIEGPGGALYGTTSGGGASNAGTVFRLEKDGSGFRVLHDFGSFAGDGNTPLGGLVVADNGAFFGTAVGGGLSNLGCIYRLNSDGTGFTNIHNFTGVDGSLPVAGLLLGASGAMYGTTKTGGSNNLGTVFTIALDGGNFAVLHQFEGKDVNDGSLPLGALVEAGAGFLYGTTYSGGSGNDQGTIFKVSTNGADYAVLHSFQGGTGDGSLAVAGLSRATVGGRLCGTTPHGGIADGGILFTLSVDGSGYAVLHTFNSVAGDGSFPFAPPLAASDGAFYGSTYFGGSYTTNGVTGVLFRLFAGVPQIHITSITRGPVGVTLQFAGGASGCACQIQASTELSAAEAWQVIGTNSAAIDGTFSFFDAGASNYAARFYRGVLP